MKTNTYTIKLIVLVICLFFLIPITQNAQTKSEHNHSKEIIANNIAPSKIIGNQRIESVTNISRVIYAPNFKANHDKPEVMARQYLNANAPFLTKKNETDDLEFQRTIETPGGYKVHFAQKADGYPIYGSTINVSVNRNDEIVFVSNSYTPIRNLQTDISITPESAMIMAINHIGIIGKLSFEKIETIVYPIDLAKSVVAYKVILEPAEDHFGSWEIIIDASGGKILRAEDKACYHHPDGDKVNGTAHVFDPDPITNAKTVYGESQFVDNNDADSDSLTAQLKTVTLNDISFDGSNYKLEGPYAAIVDFEAPFTGLYEQSSSEFHYTRSNEAFEAVNAYYHLDKSMRYINETLGFNVMPYQYPGGVRFDPHGYNGVNNAQYNLSGVLEYGSSEYNVDTGEDHAIILHELGHAIHDWITYSGLSTLEGLSEGLSDYWAQSYTRSLGKFLPEDEAYDWYSIWGGMPGYQQPSLRVTNYGGHYPEDLTGLIHTDGQMWSSSLMSIYDLIGKEATDINTWEAISMLNGNATQADAAFAFAQANKELYGGAHLEDIYAVFSERGYFTESLIADFLADEPNGEGPREVVFSDISISFMSEIVSWEWDFNNDGIVDSYNQNPSYTFSDVGAYTISLSVSDGEFTESIVKKNFVTVNGGFFVFEKEEYQVDKSGAFIRDFLESRGYDVIYSHYYPSSLIGFDAAFLSFGNVSVTIDESTSMGYHSVIPLQEYLKQGGILYTEGSPFLSVPNLYLYSEEYDITDLFGVDSILPNGSAPENPISKLTGTDGSIHQNMLFTESNQQNNKWIDNIIPSENATIPFMEDGYGNVSVYNEGEYGQKTYHFAYSLADLVDENPTSSRYNFLIRLMEFFGYVEEEGYIISNFLASDTKGESGIEVQFTDLSLVDEGYEITSWAWDLNGDGEIDSYDQNPVWVYNEGGFYDVSLVVSGDIGSDTLVMKDYITVRSGILVYEGGENENGYSGSFIHNYLRSHWYEVSYTNTFPQNLNGYDVLFLSFGNKGHHPTSVTGDMYNLIFDFCLEGGKVYIEGGDAMVESFSELKQLFGLADVMEGVDNILTDMSGQSASLADGLQFNNSSQLAFESIDYYELSTQFPGGVVAFEESNYGPVAVQFDGSQMFGQKTFCMSYALADLEDGEGMNTRNELLSRILNFFDVVADVEANELSKETDLKVFPNPAKNQITLQLNAEESGNIKVEVFDLSGRKVGAINQAVSQGLSNIEFNISGFNTGIYYFRLQSGNYSDTIKWVKID